jgi:hypothetical protein
MTAHSENSQAIYCKKKTAMTRQRLHQLVRLNSFLLSILFLCAEGALATPAQADGRPNVLFIGVDDLRPEIACYGIDKMVTPNLDRLARHGVRFDLEKDLQENRNIAKDPAHAEVQERLKAMLDAARANFNT